MTKPIAIGGDVFGGPFSHGIRKAGFEVPLHVEHANYGAEMCHLNFKGLEIRAGEENWRTGPIPKNVALLFTNPPCAPWSAAGVKPIEDNKNRHLSDERADCSGRLLSFAIDVKAKTWVWESVIGAWTKGRDLVLAHARRCQANGYAVTVLLQNNMYLGAPQNRKRMLFIAHKHPLVFPKFTKPKGRGEYLRGVDPGPIDPKLRLPKGHVWLWEQPGASSRTIFFGASASKQKWIEKHGGRVGFLVKRPDPLKPPPVVLATLMHPEEPRYMTFEEGKALNGLPRTWKKPERMKSDWVANTMLSRAVLSGVGCWIGKAIKAGLEQPALSKKQRTFIMRDVRNPEAIHEEDLEL